MSLSATRPRPESARLETAVLGTFRILTASSPLSDVLREILDWATVAVPAEACSLLVRAEGADDVVQATDVAVDLLTADAVSRLSSPVSEALSTRTTRNVGRVHTDPRWTAFGSRTGGAALRSVLTTGFALDERTTAVLSYWSSKPDAFDPADADDAAEFAARVAPVLLNTVLAGDLRRRNDNLTQALTSRAVIDQAIGIVISRTGSTADEALDRLRAISQREHVKVHEVARRTVRDAVNRTRARLLRADGTAGAVAEAVSS